MELLKRVAVVAAIMGGVAVGSVGIASADTGCKGMAGQDLNSTVCTNPGNYRAPGKGGKPPISDADAVDCIAGFRPGYAGVAEGLFNCGLHFWH